MARFRNVSQSISTPESLQKQTLTFPSYDKQTNTGGSNGATMRFAPEGDHGANAGLKAARDFLEFLYEPQNIEEYNASQLGFTPTASAAAPDDPRIAGMIPYVDKGQVYQGPSVLVPKTIPVCNYAQARGLGAKPATTLATMDADWARIAFRAPIPTSQDSASAETEESAP